MIHGIARDLQRAAKRRQKHAHSENAGEQPLLIDTECGHHVAILRRRAHQNAPARAAEQQPQGTKYHRTKHDQKQIVGWNVLAEEIDRPPESRRAAADKIIGPPDQNHDILDHQGETEGRKKLEQFRRFIDPPQQDHLDQNAKQRDDHCCNDNTAPESQRAGQTLRQRERDIGAEHIECAVSKIHDPCHAEDDRQPRSNEEQRCCARKAGQELDKVEAHTAIQGLEIARRYRGRRVRPRSFLSILRTHLFDFRIARQEVLALAIR